MWKQKRNAGKQKPEQRALHFRIFSFSREQKSLVPWRLESPGPSVRAPFRMELSRAAQVSESDTQGMHNALLNLGENSEFIKKNSERC